MKRAALAFLLGCCTTAVAGMSTAQVSALSLKVAPVEYRTELKTGEKKKGFIDVSNPATQTVRVKATAEAFAQTDDNGTLRFYPDEQVSQGVQLDLDEFDVAPRQVIRMYFQLDGTKLPSGDIFAAVLFTLEPNQPRTGVAQTIRLGTLLSIVNGTPGPRKAEIVQLSVPFFNLGDTINGAYRIKNTSKAGTATGFYPDVQLSLRPVGESKTQRGKLIFPERTRGNTFQLKAPPLGFYQIKVGYRDSAKLQWVFVIHPLILMGLVIVGLLGVVGVKLIRRRSPADNS